MITVVVPTIPPRADLLDRALASVRAQTLQPARVIIELDGHRQGAMATRNRALQKVTTPWVAFLDDDDELLPCHLELLAGHAGRTGADLVYPWFIEEPAPYWDRRLRAFGQPFDKLAPQLATRNWIPVTVLARTDLLRRVGGFQYPYGWRADSEDWGAWQAMYRAGANIQHLPYRTWVWHRWQGQTRGRPRLWPALTGI